MARSRPARGSGGIALGTKKNLERENRELKETLAELYLENMQLKKLGNGLRRHKSVGTSVITAESLARLPKGSKS